MFCGAPSSALPSSDSDGALWERKKWVQCVGHLLMMPADTQRSTITAVGIYRFADTQRRWFPKRFRTFLMFKL
jgi:hypothetical protein